MILSSIILGSFSFVNIVHELVVNSVESSWAGMYRDVQGCTGMCRDVQGCAGMYRDVQECAGEIYTTWGLDQIVLSHVTLSINPPKV